MRTRSLGYDAETLGIYGWGRACVPVPPASGPRRLEHHGHCRFLLQSSGWISCASTNATSRRICIVSKLPWHYCYALAGYVVHQPMRHQEGSLVEKCLGKSPIFLGIVVLLRLDKLCINQRDIKKDLHCLQFFSALLQSSGWISCASTNATSSSPCARWHASSCTLLVSCLEHD